MPARRLSPLALLLMALLVGGCAEPPNKELHQAQGAIDAARAAGADQYAKEEYAAAVDALKRANDAVAQRDYRLALNNALDSRERAQNAARDAADRKAQARGAVERALAELTVTMAQAQSRLDAAPATRATRTALRPPRATLAAANAAVQKAGAAIEAGDYPAAMRALEGVKSNVDGAIAQIDTAVAAATRARRR